ncbi:glycosyltransferase family 4 protein [Kribbella sp. CA-293567]|uniref:glycosyltransferase family 4 protein n=1 Tax=Kribbella sp. CA-293567 TaxID=3002436 RepID=UPI0022DD8B62|nr:glycosyltransferase family 1 protein [Kribbella sp. CA-293567]WBQ08703.1 glycosyltransferase family 1 protein [Kribbella sp. CA-293567]
MVAESFLPQINGVANTVRHVADRLLVHGHQLLIIAAGPGPDTYQGVRVIRARSFGIPGYKEFPVGLPDPAIERAMAEFRPDLVHLASPFILGAYGLRSARRLGLPTVAVFQTDLAAFARQYPWFAKADRGVQAWIRRVHSRADRTLAPSSASVAQLVQAGVPRVHTWGRGVNLELFDPGHRDERWRREISPGGKPIVGYVGRLAAEKKVKRLAELAELACHVVVVGDGPDRATLENTLPNATFLGMRRGSDLASIFAGLDVFVHTGEHETFCQTIQEAQASGVVTVGPAAGGPLDLIRPGVSGLLFEPGRAGSLRQAVAQLLDNPDERVRMAAAGRRRVQTRTWPAVVDDLVGKHYAEVLEEAAGRDYGRGVAGMTVQARTARARRVA